MNKLLSILLVSCMFAGELEVEGDLNVSGEVQSPTIEALLAQIAALEAQIALMQVQLDASQGVNNFATGIYELTFEGEHNNYIPSQNLSELTGISSDWYKVELLSYNHSTISGSSSYSGRVENNDEGESSDDNYSYGNCNITTGNGGNWGIQQCTPIFANDSHPYIYYFPNGWFGNYTRMTLTVLITAQSNN